MDNNRAQQLLREGISLARGPEGRESARRCFREAVALDPACEKALLWLAEVAESPEEALGCLEKVLVLNPEHEKAAAAARAARLRCGISAAKGQDKPRARDLLRQATTDNPADEMAWLWLASVAETPAEGVLCLEQVLQLNPENERARGSLERFREQIAARRLTSVPASDGGSLSATADIDLSSADDAVAAPEEACPFCQTPLPDGGESCLKCGALQYLASVATFEIRPEGDLARWQAFVTEMEATDYQADFAACYRLGLARMNLGQFDAAQTVLKHALWLKPDDAELQRTVEELVRVSREKARDAVSGSGRTVLIVDDSASVRDLVSRTLEARSYEVRTAGNGYEAIDVLRDHGAPDLILLDVAMPGLDGLQLCKLLRQNPDTARLPIVMLSESEGLFGKIRGSMAGSTENLSKPFDVRGLVQVVERYCLRGSMRVNV